jgi:hypothetical protein
MRPCQHYSAVEITTTEGHQLEDGRWVYSKRYRCPQCEVVFVESHEQPLASGSRPHTWERRIEVVSPSTRLVKESQ